MNNIDLFKQVAMRWLHNQLRQIMGNGVVARLVQPIADELLGNLQHNPMVDVVLGMFVDNDGNFNIDKLLDKYIDSFATDGDIRFKWGDISPNMAFLDTLSGGKTIVITAEDIRELKDSFMRGLPS
ncbi:MAG: hypothetical protein II282_03500 [Alistipes sp.]|nr:hypothetical protein [Alistipes sp.]